MDKQNKIAALGVASVAAFTLVAAGGVVSAHQTDNSEEFAAELSERLGVDQSEVQSAMEEIREEHRSEMQAEIQAKIDEAVDAGDLTDRQAEILNAMQEIREENPRSEEDRPDREDIEAMTEEEREAFREERSAEHQQEMIDALAEKGLDVSADELETLRETMKELGIGGGHHGGRGGPRGDRGGQGFRTGGGMR